MTKILTSDEINMHISTGEPVLIYFSGANCQVCQVLKPKIEQEITKNFPRMKLFEIKADESKELASSFSVFSIPTILVFFDSKEFFRKSRNLSVSLFIDELKRPYNLFID